MKPLLSFSSILPQFHCPCFRMICFSCLRNFLKLGCILRILQFITLSILLQISKKKIKKSSDEKICVPFSFCKIYLVDVKTKQDLQEKTEAGSFSLYFFFSLVCIAVFSQGNYATDILRLISTLSSFLMVVRAWIIVNQDPI